ncbi:MAG: 30S ribosomal protein S13 [Nanoarchaeota archaeon]|nr:30S ribosomal protein S13 [Nanoarchaeota archaeon]
MVFNQITAEPREKQKMEEGKIIRILSKDISGDMKIYPGLTKIKGVSWAVSNAVCNVLKIDKKRKVVSLTEEEIKKISEFIKNPKLPYFIVNRRSDRETGGDLHFIGTDLELKRDFDIKRLKQIKSYKGIRHASGQPVRGQRTKAHFRTNRRRGVGIKVKTKKETKEYIK